MKLEAVTVCVDYSDFLAETIPANKSLFDKWVIVTSPEDLRTQHLCEYHDIECAITDSLQTRWGEFHKGKGINDGLSHLALDGWCLHVDADVVLPPRSRILLDRADHDRSFLLGADRLRVQDHETWRAHQALPAIQQDGYHVRLDAFPLIPRFNAWHLQGYTPPGYFQLWHPYTTGVRAYPDEHGEADRTDILFAQQWPRQKRQLIPEFAVYHLDSEEAAQGVNWAGRQTQQFGPDPLVVPARRRRAYHRHHHHRHHPPYGPLAEGP